MPLDLPFADFGRSGTGLLRNPRRGVYEGVRRILVALPLVLFISCTDDAEQLGVSVIDGQPVAVSTPCRNQSVASLEVLVTENDNHPGGGDDQVLWRAVARNPGPTAFATPIGEAPDGFDSTIPLAEPLSGGRDYTLYLQRQEGGAGVIIFRPDALKAGRIETEMGSKSVHQFRDYASDCASGWAAGADDVIRSLS
jgi:hypothetical protein